MNARRLGKSRLRIRAFWRVAVLLVVGGYAIFVVAAVRAPGGPHARRLDVPAVAVGFCGITLMVIGIGLTLWRAIPALRRGVRAFGHRIARPGDRELALRWNTAVMGARAGATHLVYLKGLKRFGNSGCKAWCQPFLAPQQPHSSWFAGRTACAARSWSVDATERRDWPWCVGRRPRALRQRHPRDLSGSGTHRGREAAQFESPYMTTMWYHADASMVPLAGEHESSS